MSHATYRCKDCGARWRDVSPEVGEKLVRCNRCESENFEVPMEKVYFGLRVKTWIWLVLSVISSVVVGVASIIAYISFSLELWIIAIGFIVGFFVPLILYAVVEISESM